MLFSAFTLAVAELASAVSGMGLELPPVPTRRWMHEIIYPSTSSFFFSSSSAALSLAASFFSTAAAMASS
eukprot:12901746-Ditylum_brightwellii.AAC.1